MIKVGTDIVMISRVAALSKTAKSRIFHEHELKGTAENHAAVFALKECCKKIYGKSLQWKAVEVRRTREGAPLLFLSGNWKGQTQSIHASVSHDGEYALAFVVAILK